MASIGPQIPEHLLKQRTVNESESDHSEEEVGPRLESSTRVAVGPQIPDLTSPHTSKDEEEDDDEYGPALPPGLLVKRPTTLSGTAEVGPSTRSLSLPGLARRTIGPSLPGRERSPCTFEEDEEGEDEYGPKPPGETVRSTDAMNEGVREFLEREERRKKNVEEAAKPKKAKREEWMLVPPSSSDLLGRLSDPTKLKARQFSRGGSTASRSAPNNLWTETPEERQQRIADEVAGKKRRAANAEDDGHDDRDVQRKRQRDIELRRVVDEHTKSSRGKALVEMHQDEKKKEKKNKDDEKPPAIWEHSRDMAPGGRLMDEKQRSKMISEARSLGDRFGSGKSGGYL